MHVACTHMLCKTKPRLEAQQLTETHLTPRRSGISRSTETIIILLPYYNYLSQQGLFGQIYIKNLYSTGFLFWF